MLWNSEYGEGDSSGMSLATNLNLDLYWLHPTAWVYWQVIDGNSWGLLHADENASPPTVGPVNPKWYVLAQYSRHIRPGFSIIGGGADKNTVAAFNNATGVLVIITTNYGTPQTVSYDLSAFTVVADGIVSRWCTNTAGPQFYSKHRDVKITGKVFSLPFDANTVQTIEVTGVQV